MKNYRVLYSIYEDYDVADYKYFNKLKQAIKFAKRLKKCKFVSVELVERDKYNLPITHHRISI